MKENPSSPPAPQCWGVLKSKSPSIGGFRGLSITGSFFTGNLLTFQTDGSNPPGHNQLVGEWGAWA